MKQHTLNAPFSFESKGLHTGLHLHATFLPAAENTGIRICRTDLEGRPTYQAIADYVTATERGTVLERGAWKVSTVEHALSALYAMGVDNCLIEVDGPEMPILDGSAKYYVKAIQEVGLQEQDAEQKVAEIRKNISELEERIERIAACGDMAEKEEVEIKQYSVIYHAIEDIEAAMKGMLDPEFEEKVIGNAEIRQTFKVSNVGTIAGCYVTNGKVSRNAGIRLIRDNVVVHEGKLISLKRFKDDAKEVAAGYECGIQIENFNDIKEGDNIEGFVMEEVKR